MLTRLENKEQLASALLDLVTDHMADKTDVKLGRRERREVLFHIIDLIEDQNLFKQQKNFFLLTDFYKQTHWLQVPLGTTEIYSYYENRKSMFPKQLFIGLSYIIQEYLVGTVA